MLILSIQKWWHWESLFLVGTSCMNSEQSRALHKVAVVGFIQTCFAEFRAIGIFCKERKGVLETFVLVKRMWIHLGGKTKNQLLLFADGKGLRPNGQKKRTVIYSFFPSYNASWYDHDRLSHGVLLSPFPGYSVVPVGKVTENKSIHNRQGVELQEQRHALQHSNYPR